MISSISYDNAEILKNIMKLHNNDQPFEADVTYSKGNFYKNTGVPQPKYKFDLIPQTPDTVEASSTCLPLSNEFLTSIMFDPPFVIGGGKTVKDSSKTMTRFGRFRSPVELWTYYNQSLKEFGRVLTDKGLLVVKCQDTIESRKQHLSHIYIVNSAIQHGFYPLDLFVLLAKNRLIDTRWKNQEHARKYHCYFLVFRKAKFVNNYHLN